MARAYAVKLEKLGLAVESLHKNHAISSTAYSAIRTAGPDTMKPYKKNTKKSTWSFEEFELPEPAPAEPEPEPVPELDLEPAAKSKSPYEAVAAESFVFNDPQPAQDPPVFDEDLSLDAKSHGLSGEAACKSRARPPDRALD